MNIKLVSVILSLLILITLLSGCNKKKFDNPKTNNSETQSITTSSATLTDDKTPSSDITSSQNNSDNTINSNKNNSQNDKTPENSNSVTSNKPQSSSKPQETQNPENSQIQSPKPEVKPNVPSHKDVNYEQYHKMAPTEQQSFFNSFATVEDFFKWYNEEKAEYEKNNPDKEIGDGSIDIGELIK